MSINKADLIKKIMYDPNSIKLLTCLAKEKAKYRQQKIKELYEKNKENDEET